MVYTNYDPLSILYSSYLSPSPLISSTNTVKQVFANMELLGWYTTGDVPTAEDTHFHEQVCLVEKEGRDGKGISTQPLKVPPFIFLVQIILLLFVCVDVCGQ